MSLPHILFPDRPVVPKRWSNSYQIIQAIECLRRAEVRITVRRIQELTGCTTLTIQGWMSRNESKMPDDVEIIHRFLHLKKLRQTHAKWSLRAGTDWGKTALRCVPLLQLQDAEGKKQRELA